MKKFILSLIIAIAVFFIGLHTIGGALLYDYSKSKIPQLTKFLEVAGFKTLNLHFDEAGFEGLTTAYWDDLSFSFVKQNNNHSIPINAVIGRASLSIKSVAPLTAHVELHNFKAENVSKDLGRNKSFLLFGKSMQFSFDLEIGNINASLRNTLNKFHSILESKPTDLKIDIDATVRAQVDRQREFLHLYMDKTPEGYLLRFAEKDIRKITSKLDTQYTNQEIAFASQYPFRLTRLLEIKNTAASTAKKAFDKNKKIPEDAYRHILWSYLLTNEYGDVFAALVTDAHEEDSQKTRYFDSEMDLINNKIGRKYALQRVHQEQILSTLLNDSKVIHKVKEFTEE